MAEQGGARSLLQYGCLGCVGLVAVLVIFGAVIFGVAALKVRSEDTSDHEVSREVPGAREREIETGNAPGLVILDLRHADFEIGPAAPGTPIRVEATFDERDYRLEESLEGGGEDGAPWVYRCSFRRTGSGLVATIKQLLGGSRPRARIELPEGSAYALQVELSEGGAEVELGGLALTSAEIRLDKGGLELGFSDPTPAPLERLAIRGSMGGMSVRRVGNASPAELVVDLSMGGMDLDLSGRWVRDADIEISTRMSGGSVRLPRDVNIRGLDTMGSVSVEPRPEVRLPTLTFSASSNTGELEFRR